MIPADNNKINLLVVSNMLPQNETDIAGIFVLDYLQALEPHCTIHVLNIGIGQDITDDSELRQGIHIQRYHVPCAKNYGIYKALAYTRLFLSINRLASCWGSLDLIHAHGSTISGIASFIIARKHKIPVIITEHSNPSKLMKSFIMKSLTRRALEHADAVLPVSEDLRQKIESFGIKLRRVFVTHNPVDTELFQPTTVKKSTTSSMVFAGRLEHFKGGLRTVNAFDKIDASRKGWNLTLIGDGPEENAIRTFIRDRGLEKNVRLMGRLTKSQIAEEFRKAAFFVFPSAHETFGITIAEAMSSGLPVIVGNATAPVEFVDSESGLLVPPDNIDEIARAMEYLMVHWQEYNSMKIRAKIVERFGFNTFGERMNQIYREVMRSSFNKEEFD